MRIIYYRDIISVIPIRFQYCPQIRYPGQGSNRVPPESALTEDAYINLLGSYDCTLTLLEFGSFNSCLYAYARKV
jgi:hypothetical protein